MRPLEGLVVLEFCQFLAGPSAGLKLADLGARVIKIERPVKGEACRQLSIKDLFVDDSSLLFHTINRNKESFAADLKNPEDLILIKKLIAQADIMTHNFRPGVMEKIGLDFNETLAINPKIIYGTITGYGTIGPWSKKPGQDLLLQSLSGLSWLSGRKSQEPVPFGLAVADLMCGNHFVQGILAALLKRAKTGKGVLVEVSLLESVLDVQFEAITSFLNDGGQLPERGDIKGSAHAFLSAPYGVYPTQEGYLSLAMGDLIFIGNALGLDLNKYADKQDWFTHRDEIRTILSEKLASQTADYWLEVLQKKGIWCGKVFNYEELDNQPFVKELQLKQIVENTDGKTMITTRSPIQLDGKILISPKAAPKVGEDNLAIHKQFLNNA
ncbi:carnitine dehydratase [Flavobacterium aquidurense]|jgi:CoA:oxalate CoA-transferase|uniref:CaiB/BaiF CoA transferase family protein n=1 Tax=Flavobacterium aquidurense TaxID=362413 RepID=UPI0009142905|nr:CoA transferase [Flavobacterium aquidurense]OXA69884.1 carnitine dehydratase [Flavobacterium aquidurense]SHG52191.1 Crotonobetainyl-CoA:carnitine CoA-transferase CaiB [Flavobacterium frigidimaris]